MNGITEEPDGRLHAEVRTSACASFARRAFLALSWWTQNNDLIDDKLIVQPIEDEGIQGAGSHIIT